MLLKTYFKRIYPHIRAESYRPSRKNSGIFVTRCFCAAGSNYFTFTKRKRYTSEDVPSQRKFFDGSRKLTPDIKRSFQNFDVDGLANFYKENLDNGKVREVMLAFGIPPTVEVNIELLCSALAVQFKAFIDSTTDEADDIVSIEYQKLLAEPQKNIVNSYQPSSVLYPDDQVYPKAGFRPIYQANIYEKILHTWEFENYGTQTWRGRKLYFSNHDAVRPRADTNYIDIPDTPPHKGVKITAGINTRGFEGTSECRWIMVDSENNDCFPNSNMFTIVIITKFVYEK